MKKLSLGGLPGLGTLNLLAYLSRVPILSYDLLGFWAHGREYEDNGGDKMHNHSYNRDPSYK